MLSSSRDSNLSETVKPFLFFGGDVYISSAETYPRRLFSRVDGGGAVVERSEGSSRVYLYSFNLHMKATTGAAVSESVEWKMKSLCDSRRRRQRINWLCFLMSGFFA